ncbi:translation initiation factor IF-2-like [Phocoena sinus]|uniref:translation initiation factor IF-2-like n=1 Tax=Phocoena sinus TaxID=42100 RepID=UPI0013C4B7A9|nr:translation initiation factor IF-2-like [Phocoena sinus]
MIAKPKAVHSDPTRSARRDTETTQNNKEQRRPLQESQSEFNLIPRQTAKGVRGRRTDPGDRRTRGTTARSDPRRGRRPVRRPRWFSGPARRPPARYTPPPPPPGARPGAGKPRAGCAGPVGRRGGTWRVTWARATARGVRSRPRGRRPRPSPGGPERSSAPALRRPGQAAPPRRRAAARAGRAASSSRAAPRQGAPLAGRPAPRTRSRSLGGRAAEGRAGRASGGERAAANAGSATRATPLPQRRRRPGPCCCCQLVERTLSMRAQRPHPDLQMKKLRQKRDEIIYSRPHCSFTSESVLPSTTPVVLLRRRQPPCPDCWPPHRMGCRSRTLLQT